jgi:serine phosphatase RsbU (regulator of sigma subunit)
VASPGIWVLTVLVLDLTVGGRVQVTPLLAAAPAIACAGTGRRQCAAFGCGCALFALTPIPDEPSGIGQRVGTASAIVAVALAGYLIAQRRIGLQRSLDEVRRVADVAQRVLLRPVPARIGPVAAAVGYLAAAPGARIGGDFYEVIETPYGLRAILGDMRGSGLDAVGGAAALLGAFREAGAVEPDLGVVAARLDAALTRYAVTDRPPGADGSADGGPDLRTEDFATAVLVQVSVEAPTLIGGPANVGVGVGAGADSGADSGAGTDSDSSTGPGSGPDLGLGTGLGLAETGPGSGSGSGTAELIVCGHPAPYLLQSCGTVRLLTPEDPTPPLGMRLLAAGPQPLTSFTVALRPGESLVCYTDGITESRDRSGVFFPLADVLAAVLADTDSDKQPKGIATAVRTRLAAHSRGAMRDDAAVLILRRLDA